MNPKVKSGFENMGCLKGNGEPFIIEGELVYMNNFYKCKYESCDMKTQT